MARSVADVAIAVLTNEAMAVLSLLYFFEVDWLSSDSKRVGSGVRYLCKQVHNTCIYILIAIRKKLPNSNHMTAT